MKFTDLDITEQKEQTIKIDLDGFTLKVGDKDIDLKGQWIEAFSTESEIFQNKKIEMNRRAILKEEVNPNELVSCLIHSWSFDDLCTEENKLKAVSVWPKILVDHIDRVASSQINFTKKQP